MVPAPSPDRRRPGSAFWPFKGRTAMNWSVLIAALLSVCLVGGHPATSVAQQTAPTAGSKTFALRGDVVDALSGAPVACRIYIQGSDGAWHFAKSESPR